uniref:CTP synthase n=1 Tax=Paramoeba aestuarina TaxID=180227 RepID=A0A7S4L239_9EUKA|mmetsp:Transcript_29704/g.45908  ORF Transcript_29704/g.45908 Transcript_29704/m.45908 type:complete len:622 (+) Transcript_29704:56-1921(+)
MAHVKLLSLATGASQPSNNNVSYILVTGGTLSGIGKGVIASSTGLILRSLGFNVTSIKIDPYLNIDAGTMSPFEHGEVFVMNDGGEVDLDLGNYERFIGISLSKDNNITTGKIYNQVIERERRGDYLGKTVQVVPHIVDAIQDWIERVAQIPTSSDKSTKPEVCVIELGGTVGDIESSPFIEALRQLQFRVGIENFLNIHVALVPVMGTVGEQKTKPIQQSVRTLRACGLFPDIIVCRSSTALLPEPKKKISQFCQVHEDNVLSCPDDSNLYRVPLSLVAQKLDYLILHRLSKLPKCTPDWTEWTQLAETASSLAKTAESDRVRVVVVGKYTGLADSYLSLIKSLKHASISENVPIDIQWIESTDLEEGEEASSSGSSSLSSSSSNVKFEQSKNYAKAMELLKNAHAILVPGGFGDRGIEGKITAIHFARTNNIPYFGICLGMQMAVIEYTRNVLGMKHANSEEFDPECHPKAVVFMPEISKEKMGGTMRLGRRTTFFVEKYRQESVVRKLYQEGMKRNYQDYGIGIEADRDGLVCSVDERHRHRYEVNPELVQELEEAGMAFVGTDVDHVRMEVIELMNDHPYFVGVQYHPEFQSRLQWPSPPFVGFIRAARNQQKKGEV